VDVVINSLDCVCGNVVRASVQVLADKSGNFVGLATIWLPITVENLFRTTTLMYFWGLIIGSIGGGVYGSSSLGPYLSLITFFCKAYVLWDPRGFLGYNPLLGYSVEDNVIKLGGIGVVSGCGCG